MDMDCGDCGGSDLDGDGDVDVADLDTLTRQWLKEKCHTYLP
jgi:hypothetical protein